MNKDDFDFLNILGAFVMIVGMMIFIQIVKGCSW